MDEEVIGRGQVRYALLEPVLGCEQGGRRPVIVVSNDMGNRYGRTVVVVPVTTGAKPGLPTHVQLGGHAGLRQGSIALCEQVRTVDKRRLVRLVGRLDARAMSLVDAALEVALGLAKGAELIVLCPKCAASFRDAGAFSLRRTDPDALPREACTVCSTKLGVEYVLSAKRGE